MQKETLKKQTQRDAKRANDIYELMYGARPFEASKIGGLSNDPTDEELTELCKSYWRGLGSPVY